MSVWSEVQSCMVQLMILPLAVSCFGKSRLVVLFWYRLSRVVPDKKGKGKVFPYSLPSVGTGADPSVQAVSPQLTLSHPPGGRLPLLSVMLAVTFQLKGRYQIILLGDRGTCM